jgi:peptidoglycan hydrolase-like protein with peptidoglycan-binding domain
MRIIGAGLVGRSVLFVLLALWPNMGAAAPKTRPAEAKPTAAQPQQPKTTAQPAQPKPPAAGTPRAVYAAMPEHERMMIQADLIWTGFYDGIIDSDFGDNSVAAVKAFQKYIGGRETGLLNPDERAKLSEAARARREKTGWRVVDDRATGVRVGVPGKLVPQSEPSGSGTRWQSSRGEIQVETFRINAPGTTLAAVFERMQKEPANRRPEYKVLKSDFFVVSGAQGGVKRFYVRAQIKGDEVRGVAILYDNALEPTVERVVVAVSNAFVGFPAAQAAVASAPAPRRLVEYATGIVVSKAGHIVTDRAAVDDCQFLIVPGFGNAARVADDKASGLTLLQVFAAKDLTPAALADGGRGSDVTLVGIADPQAQDGGSAVSSLKARLLAASDTAQPIEPAPALGFAGAAALDGDAQLVGMVDVRASSDKAAAQAVMVPAAAIRTFLTAQSIAPPSGPASLDDAKAALVRVICVRK